MYQYTRSILLINILKLNGDNVNKHNSYNYTIRIKV